MRETNIR